MKIKIVIAELIGDKVHNANTQKNSDYKHLYNDVLFIPMCAEYMQQINKLVSFDELAQLCIQMYGAPLTFNIQCIIATMHSE